jgi:hypothetical protein
MHRLRPIEPLPPYPTTDDLVCLVATLGGRTESTFELDGGDDFVAETVEFLANGKVKTSMTVTDSYFPFGENTIMGFSCDCPITVTSGGMLQWVDITRLVGGVITTTRISEEYGTPTNITFNPSSYGAGICGFFLTFEWGGSLTIGDSFDVTY